MFQILAGVAPFAALSMVFLTGRTRSRSQAPTPPRGHDEPAHLTPEERWEALSAEVARLERRRRLHGPDAAMHRRHLAAVLPADARR